MPNPAYPEPLPTAPALDPAFEALTSAEQRQAWWRGSDDEQAVQAGDDVEWATDDHFPSGLHRSRLKDEDWARVAYFIAKGVSVTEVARHFGVSRTTIWRGMQRSAGLRRRVLSERRMLQRESDHRFVALRDAVVTGLAEAISAGNVRVLLWAAKRLDLGGSILPATAPSPHPMPPAPAPRATADHGAGAPMPRIRRAPPAVRAILAAAATQADASVNPTPAPPPVAACPPAPEPALASAAPATPRGSAGRKAAPEPTPPPKPKTKPKTRAKTPPATTPAPVPTTTPASVPRKRTARAVPAGMPMPPRPAGAARHPWPPLRRLLAGLRPPCPPLAEDLDRHVTDTLLENCRFQGLAAPVCDNDGPVSPYRPLRHYRWP
ncbi:hypothetical protein CHU95_07445 [Niveispirillum lacus]|uniref:Resolvase HTH domain-containing protein n=1 Tax=Niveispirillum lacus TaxID=1981099 RepID=A0A255Z276_9PROT|nr:helix-turn-helix domain-containing protein [Niveispirillum lacus]OYQ35552.1 hypothetical protein CHU95_07445 [Niveispirillum lacus]